jgi:polysaccharide pyruvyl transferase WcaK-like protein
VAPGRQPGPADREEKPVNILVLGWYHHRNAGDDRMQAVLTRWLDGHTLGFLPAGRPLPASMARRWDAVLVGGGDVLETHGGVVAQLSHLPDRARVPVALIGVGAAGAPPAVVEEVQRFLPRSAFVWLRDTRSAVVLGVEPGPGARVAPDVTWLDPYPVAPHAEAHGVAVAAGPQARLDPAAWGAALQGLGTSLHPWPLWFEGGADGRVLAELLPGHEIPDRPTLGPARAAEVVVSTRYHGLVFGLQLGRPVIGVGGGPKVKTVLDEAGLGDWWVPGDRPEDLRAVLAALQADLPAARSRAAEVRVTAADAAAEAGAWALDRLTGAATPLAGWSHRRRWLRRG